MVHIFCRPRWSSGNGGEKCSCHCFFIVSFLEGYGLNGLVCEYAMDPAVIGNAAQLPQHQDRTM